MPDERKMKNDPKSESQKLFAVRSINSKKLLMIKKKI
jgi:hypothetical protein